MQVDAGHIDILEKRIARINSLAITTRAQNAAVSVDYVIGVGGHDAERIDEEVRARGQMPPHISCCSEHPVPQHKISQCTRVLETLIESSILHGRAT